MFFRILVYLPIILYMVIALVMSFIVLFVGINSLGLSDYTELSILVSTLVSALYFLYLLIKKSSLNHFSKLTTGYFVLIIFFYLTGENVLTNLAEYLVGNL
jgi:hypothetical protein